MFAMYRFSSSVIDSFLFNFFRDLSCLDAPTLLHTLPFFCSTCVCVVPSLGTFFYSRLDLSHIGVDPIRQPDALPWNSNANLSVPHFYRWLMAPPPHGSAILAVDPRADDYAVVPFFLSFLFFIFRPGACTHCKRLKVGAVFISRLFLFCHGLGLVWLFCTIGRICTALGSSLEPSFLRCAATRLAYVASAMFASAGRPGCCTIYPPF